MSARVNIVYRIPHRIVIPVQRQRLRQVPKVRILRQEVPLLHLEVSRPQILKSCIRVVAFSIVPIYIRILRLPKRHLPRRRIAVRDGHRREAVGHRAYASPRIVQIVSLPAHAVLDRDTFVTVSIRFADTSVNVRLHQNLRILAVHVVHILDQLVVLAHSLVRDTA